MTHNMSKSQELQKKAQQLIPLGVNSNFRYWGEGITPYVQKAKGSHLWDVDGNEYIDYRLAFGPIILGHSYDEVDNAVAEAIHNGTMCAMTFELEIELAQRIKDMCPCCEMSRLSCSGTEATQHALRVARAYTGRELVLKFEGNYHGFYDYMLFSTYAPAESYNNRRHPTPIPSSSGIPKALHSLVLTCPFNDFEQLDRMLKTYGYQIAAIITEPCQGNCASIDPAPGWLEFIRKKCDEYGIVFILDEVKSGFRFANGGAQEWYKIKPDMATYAKAMGNGYPLAMFGGKKEIMSIIGHGVAQGGTYNNNRPGVVAANKVLEILQREPIIETIIKRGTRLMDGLKKIFEEYGVPVAFCGHPAMFSYAIGVEKVTCQRDWSESERDLYLEIVDAAVEKGVMPDHDPREPWFLCYSHSEADIDKTLEVMRDALKLAKRK